MPELPDVTVYVEALRERIVGHQLVRVLTKGPFLLRSATPPLSATFGRTVREVRRLGKQIAIGMEDGLWLVLHLKIAGRLHWQPAGAKPGGRNSLATLPRRARSAAPPSTLSTAKRGCAHWMQAVSSRSK
jgi:formamidopyrimidine-DNA glycosylase